MSWKGGIWAEIISMLRRSGPARVARKVDGSMRRRTLVMVYSTAVFMWSPLALEPASCRAVLLLGRNHQPRGRAGVDTHLSAESAQVSSST